MNDSPHRSSSPIVAPSSAQTLIIGAGPAGLAAAYELSKAQLPVTVLERNPRYVGGLARTVEYKGFRLDIGGHRFFSKSPLIENLWTEFLGPRMVTRKRLSRIYYRGRLYKYPLEPLDVMSNLGPREALTCLASYALAPRRQAEDIKTFEDWITSSFGRRLYTIFFKTYTEKVWGIPCHKISADWAAQRIRGLTMSVLLKSVLTRSANGTVKTLIDEFRYPAEGPGEMWETVAQIVQSNGGVVRLGQRVIALARSGGRLQSITTETNRDRQTYAASDVVSTMPLAELIASLDPPAPPALAEAAARLQYRHFLMVALILDQEEVFPDQWIYVHEPRVTVARIQNFKNWSPAMVPDRRYTMFGLEYFCGESDSVWNATDAALLELARGELATLGIAQPACIIDGTVVRQSRAYPVYDGEYRAIVDRIRDFVRLELSNLHLAGRNGMHKYDNQDHAMMTGLIAAWNIMGGSYDAWRVNSDAEYLEDGRGAQSTERIMPEELRGA